MHDRTVTLPTLDAGNVPVFCPPWCRGHAGHTPQHLADLNHQGEELPFYALGRTIGGAFLTRYPYAEMASRDPYVFAHLSLDGAGLDPEGLDQLAAALVAHASILRRLARELSVILAGGAR
ncbi:hypothetical protein AB7952_11330 [Streptomyces sp. PG2]